MTRHAGIGRGAVTASGAPGSSPELAEEVNRRRPDWRARPRASPPGSSSTQAERFGEVRLRITIDDEQPPTSLGECRAEICGRGGLGDPALVIREHDRMPCLRHPTAVFTGSLYVGLSVRRHVCLPARLRERPDGTVRRCSSGLLVRDGMWQVGKQPSPASALQGGTRPLEATASDLVVRQRLDPCGERLHRQRPHRVPEQPALRAPVRQRRANTQSRLRHPGFRATNALRAHARNKAAPRLQPGEQRYPQAALRGRSWPCRWLPK